MIYAQDVAIKACEESKNFLKPGISEKKFATICEELMILYGAEKLWYPMLVNFNTNSIYCTRGNHLPSEEVILKETDIVLVDYSPMVNDLWGDYSETIAIGTDEEIMKLVRDAKKIFDQTYDFSEKCTTIGELFEYSNELIITMGYKLLDPNGNIGHSIENFSNQDKRIYISPENRNVRLHGKRWAIEPHIGMGRYGAKFENVIDL